MTAALDGEPQRARQWFWVRFTCGLLLAVAGIWISRRAFDTWGHDFAPQYVAAWLLREGKNAYDFEIQHDGFMRHVGSITTWALFYPPSAAAAALPATLLPYQTVRELWFLCTFVIMLAGLWRFMSVFLPHWDVSQKTFVLGLICCAATTRWSFKVAQPGHAVLGLFAVFVAELKQKRAWLSVLCGALVVSAKVTFGIPFFLMAIALRRIGVFAAMLGVWLALNAIGLYGMGGPAIIADYKANFAQFERPDELNYPDPRGENSLARTDWPYLLNAISPDLSRNNLIGHALTILVAGWLAFEVLRVGNRIRETPVLLALTSAVAALSMLAVYHHHYDMGILLLPVIAFLGRPEFKGIGAVWGYVLPVGLYAGAYPYERFATFLRSFLGSSEVLISRPLGVVVCIAGLVSSLVVYRAVLRPHFEVING